MAHVNRMTKGRLLLCVFLFLSMAGVGGAEGGAEQSFEIKGSGGRNSGDASPTCGCCPCARAAGGPAGPYDTLWVRGWIFAGSQQR